MSADQIESKVRNIIAEHLGVAVEQVRPESSFADDLGADSLDIVELVMAFEELFHLEIPEDEAENIRTVKDAIGYIQEHRPAA
jgi:acyl carrier protein